MPAKPQAVKYSEVAIWGSILLATLVAVIDRQTASTSSHLFMGTLFMYAVLCIIPYKLGQGRDWARYVIAIMSVLSFATLASGDTGNMSELSIAFCWATTPLDLLIIYWLFKSDSSAWFRQLKVAGKGA